MDSLAAYVYSVSAMLTVAYDVYTKASQDSRLNSPLFSFKQELKLFEHNLVERVVFSASSLDINKGLLAQFDRTGEVVQKRLETSGPQGDTRNVKRMLTSLRPEPKATKGLNELTQLLQELNRGFRDNSTLPAYEDVVRSSTFSETTPSRLSSSPAERISMPRSPQSTASSTNTSIAAPHGMDSPYRHVQSLWRASADAMTVMLDYAPDPENVTIIKSIRDRIFLWGTGLFDEDELHLDALTSATEDAQKKFREPIASHFVEIVLAQVQIMERWIKPGDKDGYIELKNALTYLKSTLVGSKMTKTILDDLCYRTVEENSQSGSSSRDDLEFLRATVEILFDYLPAISMLRTRHILRTPDLSKTSTENIIDNLQKLEHLLKERESVAKMKDLRVANLSTQAAKERADFLESKMNNKRDSKPALNDPKIEQVQRTLSDRLRDTNTKLSSQESVLLKKLFKGTPITAEVKKEISEEEHYIKETLRKVSEVTVLIWRTRRGTIS